MEKRFVIFLILSCLIISLNVAISTIFFKAPEKPPVVEKAEVPPVKKPPAGPEVAKRPMAEAEAPVPLPPEPKIEVVPVLQRWLTLGSVDEDSPYRMLVTFTNRGAAIRRVELSSSRYNALNNRAGYLGHLEGVPALGGKGVLALVVGAGTPAAEAGLRPGDVIVKAGAVEVNTPDELNDVLQQTRPGQEILLGVLRDGKPIEPLTAKLAWTPLQVMGPEARNLLERGELERGEMPPPGFVDPPSYLMTLAQLNEAKRAEEELELQGVDLIDGNWEVVEHDQEHVVFRKTLPESDLEIVKRFHLATVPPEQAENPDYPAYHLEFDIEIRNVGQAAQTVAYQLDGPTGLPAEGWWYASKISRNWWSGAGLRDLVAQYLDRSPVMFSPSDMVEDGMEPMKAKSMMYIAVDAQYFSSALVPRKKDLEQIWFAEADGVLLGPKPGKKDDPRLANVTFRLKSKPRTLVPGESFEQSFTLFAGPKRPDLLAEYGPGGGYTLGSLVYYGWPIWAFVSKIMLAILHAFYFIVGNYGVAIVLLTVLVRGLMFPLSRKQALNMIKMQELQPEMKRIQEKYKGDMEKRSKAQRELFQKNNYKPMGGCLMMFIQLPIFLGLYRALSVDVELRQAPLFGEAIRWCSNLAAPDMFYNWAWLLPEFITEGRGFFSLGPYLNVLPIITVALYIGQQKMFMPPPTDEASAMQQKMMKYMMVVVGLMFYKVASGLCLYFIASTLWSMAERKLLPKAQPAAASAAAVPAEESRPPVEAGANGRRRARRAKPKRKQR